MTTRPVQRESQDTIAAGLSIWIATIFGLSNLAAVAQGTPSQIPARSSISGIVRDSAGKPVSDASVRLEHQGGPVAVSTTTNSQGGFAFSSVAPGTYIVIAEKSGLRSHPAAVVNPSEGNPSTVTLTLEASGQSSSKANSSTQFAGPMEFADTPSFTIAAVTDWTAAGGHGSDSSLRTSEALTRDTLTLKPRGTGTGRSRHESKRFERVRTDAANSGFQVSRQLRSQPCAGQVLSSITEIPGIRSVP